MSWQYGNGNASLTNRDVVQFIQLINYGSHNSDIDTDVCQLCLAEVVFYDRDDVSADPVDICINRQVTMGVGDTAIERNPFLVLLPFPIPIPITWQLDEKRPALANVVDTFDLSCIPPTTGTGLGHIVGWT